MSALIDSCNAFLAQLSAFSQDIRKLDQSLSEKLAANANEEKLTMEYTQLKQSLSEVEKTLNTLTSNLKNDVNFYKTIKTPSKKADQSALGSFARKAKAITLHSIQSYELLSKAKQFKKESKLKLKNKLAAYQRDFQPVLMQYNHLKRVNDRLSSISTHVSETKSEEKTAIPTASLTTSPPIEEGNKEDKNTELSLSSPHATASSRSTTTHIANMLDITPQRHKEEAEAIKTLEAYMNNIERTLVYEREKLQRENKILPLLTVAQFKQNKETLVSLMKKTTDEEILNKANKLVNDIDDLIKAGNTVVFHRQPKQTTEAKNNSPSPRKLRN